MVFDIILWTALSLWSIVFNNLTLKPFLSPSISEPTFGMSCWLLCEIKYSLGFIFSFFVLSQGFFFFFSESSQFFLDLTLSPYRPSSYTTLELLAGTLDSFSQLPINCQHLDIAWTNKILCILIELNSLLFHICLFSVVFNDTIYFCLFVFTAVPVAYISSQARGLTGAAAASLCHSNTGSEPHLQPMPHLVAMLDP